MMNQTAPHFLLLSQAQSDPESRGGTWRFVLEQLGSSNRIEESEQEPELWGERLQLFSVVRGLEALEQPSRVTLITPSRFVGNGIRRGLMLWRENGWRWERYGRQETVHHVDLWKRIDQTLQFHQINCRIWDFDEPRVQKARATHRNRISFGEIQSARRLSFADDAVASQPVARSQWESRNKDRSGRGSTPERGAGTEFSAHLAGKVKPIGTGRAFGYAGSI